MGNIGSSTGGGGANHRRRHNQMNHHHHQQPPQEPFVSSTPYHQPPPPPFPYGPTSPPPPPLHGGYYNNRPPPPPPVAPMPLPAPYDPNHRIGVGPHGYPPHPYPPFPINFHQQHPHQQPPAPLLPHYVVEHQKAVTIKNNVNLKKETLSVVPDPLHPGKFLVSFTYDANSAGSITVLFFAKEGSGSDQIATKECFKPVTISFDEGLGQKFCQPSGTGIDFSMFEGSELIKQGDSGVYPLVVKADESSTSDDDHHKTMDGSNSQITQAVFEKSENGVYHVRVVKQILWVKGVRYELQEIYGIGNSVEDDFDGNDTGKECVICLSEPRDTTALPCRHLCMCSECAKLLRLQTNRCPICRQPVDRFLEIEVRSDVINSDANNNPTSNKVEEKGQQHELSPPELSV